MRPKTNNTKNLIIELLRFIFATFIIFFHMDKDILGLESVINSFGSMNITFFSNGFIGVEFFFMLTGLFMAERVCKLDKLNSSEKNGGGETLNYIFHKAKSVWPIFVVVAIIKVVLHLVLGGRVEWVIINIPSLFFLQRTGLCPSSYIYESWYISSMLIALVVVYPLCRKNYKLFTSVIAPFLGFIVYGMLIIHFGGLGSLKTKTIFYIYASNFRALAGISLGAFCFELSRRIKEKNWNRYVLISIEIVCFIAITLLAIEYNGRNACGLFVLLIFIMVMIEYSQYGLSDYVPQKIGFLFSYLGRLSLPMYLIQSVFRKVRPIALDGFKYKYQIIIMFVCIVISSIILDFAVNSFYNMSQKKQS